MNLAPVRGSYLEYYCGASPAHDMRPLQGQQRELMSCGGDRGKPLSWNMRPFQGQSPATLAASALKGQPVPSPGQRPGYQGIKPFAL